jgi:hypothetical protein
MNTQHAAAWMVACFAGLACGTDEQVPSSASDANPATTAPAVVLPVLTLTPGCYVPPQGGVLPVSDQAVVVTAWSEFEGQTLLQSAAALAGPLLADPTATTWQRLSDTTRYSAASVVRGEQWGVIEAGLEGRGATSDLLVTATIRYARDFTRFEFNNGDIFEQSGSAIRFGFGRFGRACISGVMLDLLEQQEGETAEPVVVCRVPPGPASGASEGPSIRCSNAIAHAWGSMVSGVRVFIVE